MWKQTVVAAAVVALAGACEERSQPTSNSGTVTGSRTTETNRSGSGGQATTGGERSTDMNGDKSTVTTPTTPVDRGTTELGQADATFIQDAMKANRLETELSKMALTKSQNSDVRGFAQQLSTDHTDASGRVKDLLERIRVKAPSDDLQPEQKQIRDQLTSATGSDFDEQFVKVMVDGHQKVIAAYEQEATQGSNAALRQYAQAMLPTLRNHLDIAKELLTKLGAGDVPLGPTVPGRNPG
jgi:putative membrane protein